MCTQPFLFDVTTDFWGSGKCNRESSMPSAVALVINPLATAICCSAQEFPQPLQ